MKTKPSALPPDTLKILAEFRHQLRLFLCFSETAAHHVGLQPQQHQLLLQIAGAADPSAVTIAYVAKRLSLRHNTAVELSNRCEEAGLIHRRHVNADRRSVLLELSAKGQQILQSLSADHARELNELAPQLISSLYALQALQFRSAKTPMKAVSKTTPKATPRRKSEI